MMIQELKPLPSPLWRPVLDSLTQRQYDQAAADLAKRDDSFWERWNSETESLMATYGLSHEEAGYVALRRLEVGAVTDWAALRAEGNAHAALKAEEAAMLTEEAMRLKASGTVETMREASARMICFYFLNTTQALSIEDLADIVFEVSTGIHSETHNHIERKYDENSNAEHDQLEGDMGREQGILLGVG